MSKRGPSAAQLTYERWCRYVLRRVRRVSVITNHRPWPLPATSDVHLSRRMNLWLDSWKCIAAAMNEEEYQLHI